MTKRFGALLGFIFLTVVLTKVWGSNPEAAVVSPVQSATLESPHGPYEAGTNYCVTCHQVHAPVTAENCRDCHAGANSHQNLACSECHEPHGRTANLGMIREAVWGQPVRFVATTGSGSFADGQSGDAICVVCHTATRFHRPGASETHYESQDCTRCHPHPNGFSPDPPCGTCHGMPPGNGAHPAHTGAPYSPSLSCDSCHAPVSNWWSHRDGRILFRDRANLAETTACDDCHGSGVAWAKSNWRAGARADCLTCHNASNPALIGGVVAPAKDTYWAASGHGVSGQYCTACHDRDARHITYTPGDGDRLLISGNALCQSCHGAEGGASRKVSTHGNLAYDLASQAPFDKRCADCHDSHGTTNNAMINFSIGGQAVVFTTTIGTDSYDESDPGGSNKDDLCATCHTSTAHNRTPNNETQLPHHEGEDCITCHNHDLDGDPATTDGFTYGCTTACHGQPPPPAAAGYSLDEAQLPHSRHATPDSYAMSCIRCHDDTNPAHAGHSTETPSFQDVFFDAVNPNGSYDPATRQCSTVLCHSDGAASRETPGFPAYSNPVWTDPASGACGTCHGITTASLSSGSHPAHFDPAGPDITDCVACHAPYDFATHTDGRVQFSDGETLSTTTVCDSCHSPGGAVDGMAEAKAGWPTGGPLSCEGCHDAGTSVVKGVLAPDIAGDGVTYGFAVAGHGQAGLPCTTCHDDARVHFDGQAPTYSATADNLLDGYRLQAGALNVPLTEGDGYTMTNWTLCYSCHAEADLVGLPADYSNALFTHSSPPPDGYPISVATPGTAFRNESSSGFNFGNVPANIHWDHLDMLNLNWDSDGDGAADSYPSCGACHDVHGVKSVADEVTYPAMTLADIGITYGSDAIGDYGQIGSTDYLARCTACHASGGERYYRTR